MLPGEDGREWAEGISRRDVIRGFLEDLPERERRVFLRRYWYFLGLREIAAEEKDRGGYGARRSEALFFGFHLPAPADAGDIAGAALPGLQNIGWRKIS